MQVSNCILYYFLLSSLQESELRVYARKTKGGHFVDAYMRELNCTIGLDNAVNHVRHFDTARILAKTIYFQQEQLHLEQELVLDEDYHHPHCTKEVTERFLAQIKENVKFQKRLIPEHIKNIFHT